VDRAFALGLNHLAELVKKSPSLTMSAQSTTFCRALLHALVEERHFALVDSLRCPTSGSL